MSQSTVFLKAGTFTRKKFNLLLISAIGAWLVALIDSTADSLLAGAFLDETAVSAIALVQPISSVVSFLAYLVSVGTVVMFSRECGAFHREKGYQYVGQGAIASIAIAVLLVIAMLILREPLLSFYGASGQITEIARDYYMCIIFFAASYPLYFLIYQLVNIDGDAVIGFLACAASAGFNLVASLLLVTPFGVKGLAYGTVIGTVAGLIVYCLHFVRKTNSVKMRPYFNFGELLDVVKISSSTSLTLLYIAIIDIVMNKFVICVYSDAYLPAYTVVNTMLNLGAFFCCLHDACGGFNSVAYGEKNPKGIRQSMHIAYQALVVLSIFFMVLLELAAPYAPDLYGITDPAVRSASVYAARVITISFPATAFYYLFCTYYPAVDHVWLGHLISVVYMLIAPLALAIPLGLAFGFNGLSWGFMLTSIVTVIVAVIVIYCKYGKKAVPLVLDETDEEYLSYEVYLTEPNIIELRDKICADLEAREISPSVINEVQLVLEDGYMTIMHKNEKKKVLTQCDLLISDQSLRLITRDNGVIFDITDADASIKDLRSYVLARVMERNSERTNTTTISFNRNSYYWQL